MSIFKTGNTSTGKVDAKIVKVQSAQEARTRVGPDPLQSLVKFHTGLDTRRVEFDLAGIADDSEAAVRAYAKAVAKPYGSRRKHRKSFKPERVLLISSREHVVARASLIESRLRNLRQVYASLFIAYSLLGNPIAFTVADLEEHLSDLEAVLPREHHLLIAAAGQGSFWVAVKTLAKTSATAVRSAPRAAFLTTALLFSITREKALRIFESETRKKEEESKQAAIATQKAEVELLQLKTAQEKAHDEMMAAKAALPYAAATFDLQLRAGRTAQERDQLEAFMKALQVMDALQDTEMKDSLREVFLVNARTLLGPDAFNILPLPPAPIASDNQSR